jgi:predicted short-subunit dehydrogenase-like oxidoreductase (DUF2520 family)
VIGAGRAGRSIAGAARRAGLVAGLAGRDDALAAARGAEIALLCVPDAAIAETARRIADAVPPLRFVGHVSGATGLDVLAPAADRGAGTFTFHPLQTLPDPDSELAGAACAVNGSSQAAVDVARVLAASLDMRAFELADEMRPAYHAAASMASNLMVALEEAAASLLDRTGVENARRLLAPLVERTAANWAERGGDALTGPIARGDGATVERHRIALADAAPELLSAYDALASLAAELAARRTAAEVTA